MASQSSSKLSEHMDIALSADGRTLAFGAPHADGGAGAQSGLVQVYRYDESVEQWDLIGENISGLGTEEQFGYSVALMSDGLTLVAGGVELVDSETRASGVIRIYKYDDDGYTWEQVGDDIDGEASLDGWGFAVDISADGNVVVGASRFHDDGAGQIPVYNQQFAFCSFDVIWVAVCYEISATTLLLLNTITSVSF
eukprot:scaffold294_cov221-Amphora_coffeaeformis.AAC.30